jgi:iron complex outermembrane receptor protein
VGADHTVRLGFEYRDNALSTGYSAGKIGYTVYAESAMWNWQIAPRVSLTNAVRVDELMLHYTGALVPDNRYTAADYNHANLRELSFNSGLVYNRSDRDTFRLLVARGVQAPSLVDLGLQVSASFDGMHVSYVGNPTLDASSVLNYEFDYDRTLPALNATLATALYYQRTDNLLSSALTLPLAPAAGGLASYAQNVGDSSALGGEIGLKGASASGVLWNLSYSLIAIHDHLSLGLSGPSLLLDYDHSSPTHVIDAGLGYSWNRFEVSTEARWQSHYTDYGQSSIAGIEPVLIDNYVTMNVRIAYRPSANLTVALVGAQLGRAQQLEAAGAPVERRVYLTLTGKR